MYPNQPPQAPVPTPTPPQEPLPASSYVPPQTIYPVNPAIPNDYLNQIAPQAPKRQLLAFGIKQLILIGIALIVLVSLIAIVANAIVASKRSPLEHLAAKLTTTETIVNEAQANLKSSELRSLNSNLKLYFTNTNRDVAAPLLSAGVTTKKISKSVLAEESTTSLASRLEDARLNAVYDRTYAREMAYQLGTVMTLMNQIYSSTSNPQVKTFLQSAYSSLKPTQESFANFTATN